MENLKMNTTKLIDIINTGETSKVQFKEKITLPDDFAKEIVAMANSLGGLILIGVEDKTGEIKGLTDDELHDYGTRIANIATNNVSPVVYITTEVVLVEIEEKKKKILIINICEGINKPYKVSKTLKVYVKQGDTKRQVSDNAEMLRLFQQSGNLLADEMEIYDSCIEDIDQELFQDYFKKEFKVTIEEKGLNFKQALIRKKVLRNDKLTLAGLLFFGKEPQNIKPGFCVKAVSFFGNSISGKNYRSKPADLKGTIPELFEKSMSFLETNLRYLQNEQNFNSIGILEVSRDALIEILINALIHRDYFKNAPIRLFIFDDRIEIISPGKLPNSLTVEDVKYGNPVIRNPQLVKFSFHTMPFSGIGTGITRALEEQPNIEFTNDIEGEQFIVKIPRPVSK